MSGTKFCRCTNWSTRTFVDGCVNSTVRIESVGMHHCLITCSATCTVNRGQIFLIWRCLFLVAVSSMLRRTCTSKATHHWWCSNWPKNSFCRSTWRHFRQTFGSIRLLSVRHQSEMFCVSRHRGISAIEKRFASKCAQMLIKKIWLRFTEKWRTFSISSIIDSNRKCFATVLMQVSSIESVANKCKIFIGKFHKFVALSVGSLVDHCECVEMPLISSNRALTFYALKMKNTDWKRFSEKTNKYSTRAHYCINLFAIHERKSN